MNDSENNLRIDKEYVVPGSLDNVWDCLADENISSIWQTQDCEIGEKVGDRVELFDGSVVGEFLSQTPKTELSHTWAVSEWEAEIPLSKVLYL
ncbi:MAG: hypothetical protein HeimC2_00230 [Candidatus Heimdallarchaeota archaeon LC_2]|nr:MAG: hypothetical protein HeimC2_00230 [Candidatus Heimdallarchaeota archaeon LC_2]